MKLIDTDLIAKGEMFRNVIINGVVFENYYISNYGRLYSLHRNRLLKPWMTGSKGRYCKFTLYYHGKPIDIYAHRLVASVFVINPNPEKLMQINHKDENPTNNRWDNLEWCDRSYNQRYGTASRRKREKIGIPIKQLDLQFNEVAGMSTVNRTEIIRS